MTIVGRMVMGLISHVPYAFSGCGLPAVNSIFIGSSNELGAFESGVAARLLGPVPAVVLGGLAALVVVGFTARRVPVLRELRRISHV